MSFKNYVFNNINPRAIVSSEFFPEHIMLYHVMNMNEAQKRWKYKLQLLNKYFVSYICMSLYDGITVVSLQDD